MLTIALMIVVVECFMFALALAMANEFFAVLYEVAPRPRRVRRCFACGEKFAAEDDSAYCGFCAVVAVYEHSARLGFAQAGCDTERVRAYN